MKVYIVWDHSRKEHGEPAELVDVFLSMADAEWCINDDPECWVAEDDASIEEREVKGFMAPDQAESIAQSTLAHAVGGMRVVIGDSNPRQYDKADQMSVYIVNAVKSALHKLGYTKEAT